jgi:hypothetical protein
MVYKIVIPVSIIEKSIDVALSKKYKIRGDFFHEIREAFKKNMEDIFESNGLIVNRTGKLSSAKYLEQGKHRQLGTIIKYIGWNKDIKIELDLEFCARYGHDDYSLEAINTSLPALSSLYGVFSIGNILLLVKNDDYEIEISLENGIYSTGYAYHVSKKKRKSYFCLFGIWFEPKLINSIIEKKLKKHKEDKSELDEIKLGIVDYPMLYIDRVTGKLFTCSCFDGYFDIHNDIERFLPGKNLKKELQELSILDGICNYCNGGVPQYEYGADIYYSSFLQKYLPYHTLLARIKYGRDVNSEESREIENDLREHFGYPRIGERWLTETKLYKIVSTLLPDYKVIRHYRGPELERLELDIWIPELKIGIEYQGEQHYRVIKHWGGEEGLKKRIENDQKKKQLCKKLGYHLIEIKYNEEINQKLIKEKLKNFIDL